MSDQQPSQDLPKFPSHHPQDQPVQQPEPQRPQDALDPQQQIAPPAYVAPPMQPPAPYAQIQPPAYVAPPVQPPAQYTQPGPPPAFAQQQYQYQPYQQYPQHPQQQYPQPYPQQPYGYQPAYLPVARNGYATAALTLGIFGFVLMSVPFFIGWFLGGIPDILAVIFGIVGAGRSAQLNGAGKAAAIWGLCLGGVSLLSVFIGAGTLW